jgi:hypothetical protein
MRHVLKGLMAVAAMCVAAGGVEAGKKDDTLVWATDREVPITQHAPDEHILLPLTRDALRLTAALYWDIGEGDTPRKT